MKIGNGIGMIVFWYLYENAKKKKLKKLNGWKKALQKIKWNL